MIIQDQHVLKRYVTLNSQDDIEIMTTHIEEAQDHYITEYLGEELTELLDSYVTADKLPDNPILNRLLKKVERPLACFAYMIATPFLDVFLTQSGFAVANSPTLGPASKERVAALKAALETQAHNAIERLLKHLEQNKTDYPDWATSSAYYEWNQHFVNTAKAFNAICNISDSRTIYLALRPEMATIEQLTILPAITPELAEQLREQAQNNTLTPENKLIIDLIKPAAAHLTYAAHFNMPKHEATGQLFLSRAVNIILANPANYPAAASLFETARTRRSALYENTEDSGLFCS